MPLASLPGLVSRVVPVRWRRRPRRRPRHVLSLEPLEDRALLATLTVPVPDAVTLPAGAVAAWVRELADGRYESVTLTSLDADGLRRLLADLAAGGVSYLVGLDLPPPTPPAMSPPPPPAVPGQPPPPADPPTPTLSPTPMLRGGLTLTLFRPPPTSRPDKPAEPARPAEPATEVAPVPVRAAPPARPAAPPERALAGAAVRTPAVYHRAVHPGGAAAAEGGAVRFVGNPAPPRTEGGRTGGNDGPAAPLAWDDARSTRPESAGQGAPAVGVAGDATGPPDDALLRRYAAGGDQPAFAELVRRHEAAVLRVSARVLGDADLARDAAQAAFLSLARRAGDLDSRGSLAGWLYRVAYRMALRLRRAAARRWRAERVAIDRPPPACADPGADAEQADLLRVLHEELHRLPERFRVPLVLCYLDGRTHAEVARTTGLPRGSVAKRIAEGLGRLRERLAYRGIVL